MYLHKNKSRISLRAEEMVKCVQTVGITVYRGMELRSKVRRNPIPNSVRGNQNLPDTSNEVCLVQCGVFRIALIPRGWIS